MNENDTNEREKNIFYLNWYYENFKSISKAQARTIFLIFILCFFSISILFKGQTYRSENYVFPIIGIQISIDFLYYTLPLAITLLILQFTGSLRSAKFAIKNIEYRLDKLNWRITSGENSKNEGDNSKNRLEELRLYDIDTNLNFFDYLIYNYRGYYSPGEKAPEKKIPDFSQLPYVLVVVFYLSIKIIIYYAYPFSTLEYWSYYRYFLYFSFIIDLVVSLPLLANRLGLFFKSFKNLKNIWKKKNTT